jgi:hypothetical protein
LPFWPLLQHLEVWLNETTPTGSWLCLPRPGSSEGSIEYSSDSSDSEAPDRFDGELENYLDGSQPQHSFRIILDPEMINPCWGPTARAAKHMPKIQQMSLYTGYECYRLEVRYLAPGQKIRSLWDENKGLYAVPWIQKFLIKRMADLTKK